MHDTEPPYAGERFDEFRYDPDEGREYEPHPEPPTAFDRFHDVTSLLLGSLMAPLVVATCVHPTPGPWGHACFALAFVAGLTLSLETPSVRVGCVLLYLTGLGLVISGSPLVEPLLLALAIPLMILKLIKQMIDFPPARVAVPVLLVVMILLLRR